MKRYVLTSDSQIFDTSKYKVAESDSKITFSVANEKFVVEKNNIVNESEDIRELVWK